MFLVTAALEHDPSEVHGTRQSILELANAVRGRWMLAAIGAALHARCRSIRPVIWILDTDDLSMTFDAMAGAPYDLRPCVEPFV